MKLFRTNSKKRLGEGADDEDGNRRERRTGSRHGSRTLDDDDVDANQNGKAPPESYPASAAALPGGDGSIIIDDSPFFGKMSTQDLGEWDEWSAPKEEGSSSSRMKFRRPSKTKSFAPSSSPRKRLGATRSGEILSRSDLMGRDGGGGGGSLIQPSSPERKSHKKKTFAALSAKLRKLEQTGFSDGGADVSDAQSLMAMTTGGMFVGKSATSKDRLDALMLERSNSDSHLNGKKKKKKSKSKATPITPIKDAKKEAKTDSPKTETSVLERKIRRSRRKTGSDALSKTSHAKSTRSRSRARRNPSMSAALNRSQSLSNMSMDLSDLKPLEDRNRKKKKEKQKENSVQTKNTDSPSVSTKGTLGSKSSKKKKKKKMSKNDVAEDSSSVLSEDGSSFASAGDPNIATMSPKSIGSSKGKSRKKTKKGVKRSKSTTDALNTANDDSDDTGGHDSGVIASLDSLADEIRSAGNKKSGSAPFIDENSGRHRSGMSTSSNEGGRSNDEDRTFRRKERRHSASGLSTSSGEGTGARIRRNSSNDLSSMALAPPSYDVAESLGTEVIFEKAWAVDSSSTNQRNLAIPTVSDRANEVQNAFNNVLYSAASSVDSATAEDREKVLCLQNQLAEALDKMVAISREQIEDKDQFLKASSDLWRTKAQLQEATDERNTLVREMKLKEEAVKEERQRIEKLEQAIERQLDTQDALEVKLERSEDEVEKLLIEMQQLEERLQSGEEGETGGASMAELHKIKKALIEKEAEVDFQKEKIEKLEEDLKNSLTVPQLQIEELDAEKKSLQSKLKIERLEFNQKLEAKDDTIAKLQRQVDSYTASNDAPDLVSAKQKLVDARADATAVREDLLAAQRMIDELQGEREDLVTRNNSLKDTIDVLEESIKEFTQKCEGLNAKVKQWTEKTYEWKSKAEAAERKVDAWSEESYDGSSVDDSGEVDDAPQGLFLQAAMGKGRKSKWNPFVKGGEGGDDSADNIRIRTLEERNQTLEDELSELKSEIVRMQAAHKDELYSSQKKVAQLEGENEALSLQNATLEQLSREYQSP